MSLQTRDLRCVLCGHVMMDVACEYAHYPPCEMCEGRLIITWERGKPPATDVYGCPQYSDASGKWHSSQHEKRMELAKWGFHEAGDPVGGARKDHTLKHTAISAPKLGLRTSTGERR